MAEERKIKDAKVSELVYIQSNLKAPKNQYNNFGGYNYRSCEDIMEAVKPLLKDVNCTLMVRDDIVQVENRIYVKATATLRTPSGEKYENTAFAREPESKKGLDESQITGAASSYARKYALNGLFCIDDTKDTDALNTGNGPSKPNAQQPTPQAMFTQEIMNEISACINNDALLGVWNKYPQLWQNAQFTGAVTARKDQIAKNGKS